MLGDVVNQGGILELLIVNETPQSGLRSECESRVPAFFWLAQSKRARIPFASYLCILCTWLAQSEQVLLLVKRPSDSRNTIVKYAKWMRVWGHSMHFAWPSLSGRTCHMLYTCAYCVHGCPNLRGLYCLCTAPHFKQAAMLLTTHTYLISGR